MLARCAAALCLAACSQADPVDVGDASSTTDLVTSTGRDSIDAVTGSTSEGPSADGSGSDDTSTSTSTSTSVGTTTDATTAEPVCVRNVVLMGYWPPTNEMLRRWSTNPSQNPSGWEGEDFGGLGFDVYAFFPEFPPDGDPTNDPIGSEGSVGSPESDLRVDYQDTSADFWAIVDALQPVIVLTTSRGGDIGWEIEAIEGGHGGGGPDPALDWTSDGHGPQTRPTEDSIDPRSWAAISTYRNGTTLASLLPMPEIEAATTALGLTSVAIDPAGTSGAYLSGFLGLHGLYYAHEHAHVAAAGHIHVGYGLPTATAEALVDVTLRTILAAHPADAVDCSPLDGA